MPDATSIAIVLGATVASSLLARLWRGIKRWALARRLSRSLRMAVRREIGRGPDHGFFMRARAPRPLPGPGDEDMAE